MVERLKGQRYRGSTRVTYYQIWLRFNSFLVRLDNRPNNWEDRIVLFLGHLIEDCKLQSSMVRTYLSAINAGLAEIGVKPNYDQYLIASLVRACKIRNDKVITRLPIKNGFLELILDELEKWSNEENQPYLKILYSVVFLAAYYGLLRVGEVAQGPHVILAENSLIGTNKKKLLFVLRSSKTHTEGNNPQIIKISNKPIGDAKGNNTPLEMKPVKHCPFNIISKYFAVRPHSISELEQLFVFSD